MSDLSDVVRESVGCWLHSDLGREVTGAVYTDKRGWLWCCAECFEEAGARPGTIKVITLGPRTVSSANLPDDMRRGIVERVGAPWRVGRQVGRTVYRGDELIGLMDSPGDAALAVLAVNTLRRFTVIDEDPSTHQGGASPAGG